MNKLLFLSVFLIALFAQGVLAGQKCRALALQAGGDLGSFEAGAYKALVDNLPAEEVQYDVYTGISIGSINTLGLSQFAKGEEKQQSDWLISLWSNLKRTDVYKNFPGGIVQGLFFERGIFDSSPALALLKRLVTKPPQRKISMGTCDLKTGDLVRYFENHPSDFLAEAALASGSMPTFFPYSTLEDHTYVDGGTTGTLIDFHAAIQRCRETVESDSDITLDLIYVQFASLDFWSSDKKKKTFEVYQRSQAIQSYSTVYKLLLEAMDIYPDVNFRYVIKPSKALFMPKLPFLFDNKQMNQMIQQGIDDATNIIKSSGLNGNAREVYEESVKLMQKENAFYQHSQTNKTEKMLDAYNKIKNSLNL
ncbi:patatin family phospholipase (macronuclear) [Tetrahymena thermophila SB210]|uniref:Patatin family phospholipase n=1 Tax=Tetrahymena thermophila (strain SB210) TaxID=312017 RepID=Q23BP4_TETTS|nr:patatin family phospholipase [Tetrahymena thermophila SB210]EAR94074.1 patatin family phospholipase [Tetrahymena thermophila SB210]|eukprot:XP_001014319.1 patatin family phospholipase [Tetrahymena thermophila SB210]